MGEASDTILVLTSRNMAIGSGEWRLITSRARVMWEDLGMVTVIYCLSRVSSREMCSPQKTDWMRIRCFHYRHFGDLPIILAQMALEARRLITASRPRAVVFSGTLVYLLEFVLHSPATTSIVDIHGALEEWLEYPPGHVRPSWLVRPIYWFAKCLERYIVRRCSAGLVVSGPLKEYVRREYGQERVIVVPCGVARRRRPFQEYHAVRLRWRERLGLGDSLAVVYSGGLLRWQMLDRACALFNMVKRIRRDSNLILITPDPTRSQHVAESTGVRANDLVCVSLSPEEAIDALTACDIGVLLRETNTTNVVAFPNKFSEYVFSGLVVVTSPGLCEPNQIVETNALGISIDPKQLDSHRAIQLVENDLMALVTERERSLEAFCTRCWAVYDDNINMRRALSGLGAALQSSPSRRSRAAHSIRPRF